MIENNIILLGPPACGKGTQARRLAEHLAVPCLGTGKLLRDEIEKASTVGLEAQAFIENGSYVPDEVILKMVKEWLADNTDGWLMDGFPRTIPQAVALQESVRPSKVIVLDVPYANLEFRITKRRECTTCGATIAVTSPDQRICPECGAETLKTRADDGLESFQVRYKNYEELTVPLYDFYSSFGILQRVDGTLPPDEVYSEILKIVEN